MDSDLQKIYPTDIFGFVVVMSLLLVFVLEFRTLLGMMGISPNTTIYGVFSGVFLLGYTLGFIYYSQIETDEPTAESSTESNTE